MTSGSNRMAKKMKMFSTFSIIVLIALLLGHARAADADNGKRLAQARCISCHIVAQNGRQEVAGSPPFETIGRKYDFNSTLLVAAILAPHPRMNLMLRPSEAADIAAYIESLAR